MAEIYRSIEAEIPRLRRYARALARDVAGADDLVQDCLARALEKLQRLLSNRGVKSTAAGLTAAITAGAVVSAPTSLAASVATGALAATAATASTTFTVLKLMTMTKLKISAASALIAAAVAVPVWQQARLNRLATEKTELLRQTDPWIASFPHFA